MTKLVKEEILAFINALQLCLEHEITTWEQKEDVLVLTFSKDIAKDKNFSKFMKLLEGKPDNNHYLIPNAGKQISSLLTQFLLLTRLNNKNMAKLAELDQKYVIFTRRVLKETLNSNLDYPIRDLSTAVSALFGEIAKQKLTLRELSIRTGITPVALSNFKSGKDTRLSTFIKICQALGLNVWIK